MWTWLRNLLAAAKLRTRVEITCKPGSFMENIVQKCPSLRGSDPHYWTTPWMLSGHLQTLWCTLPVFGYLDIQYERRQLELVDGATISLDFTHMDGPRDIPILFVFHGLTGGSHASYVKDLVLGMKRKGWRCVVVNYRGCAETPITSRLLYNGAYTKDMRTAVAYTAHLFPDAPQYSCGFSLGANLIVNYLAEDGQSSPFWASASIGNPWDFAVCCSVLESSFIGSIYNRALCSNLMKVFGQFLFANGYHAMSKVLNIDSLLEDPPQTMRQFDNRVTAPLSGYRDVDHYYDVASSLPRLASISRPLLAINSSDDPIVDPSVLPLDVFKSKPNLALAYTSSGGHLGWFSGFLPRRWVVNPLVEYFLTVHDELIQRPPIKNRVDTDPPVGTLISRSGALQTDDLYGVRISSREDPAIGFHQVPVLYSSSSLPFTLKKNS